VHLGKGDDFVVAEHAERVIKAGSADLGGEPLSPCCAEQGPAKFQLPLPVDHGQAEPTAPTRVPSERRWAIHFPTRSACHCRAISRPRLPPVSATRHRTSRRRRGRCAPGKDRSRALDRQGPIPTGAFRSSSAHNTRSSVGLRSVVRLRALGDSMGLNRTRNSGCKSRARGRRAASRPASGMPGVPKSVGSTHVLGGPQYGRQGSR